MIDLHQVALTSRDDLLALETALRLSAAKRYETLARAVDGTEVATLFGELAEEERRRAPTARPSDAPDLRDSTGSHWQVYLSETAEGDQDTAPPVQPTAYQALAFAVQQETRAFRRLTYVAAQAADQDLADRAEALAQERLARAAALRPARRQAYRTERARAPDQSLPLTQESLRDAALGRERELLGLIDSSTALASDIAPVRAITVELIAELSGGEVAPDIEATVSPPALGRSGLTALTAALDRSFALYDRAVSQSRDGDMQALAQALSAATVARLVTLVSIREP